ncbi:MAG: hypothetical protein KatS3mg046_132 [Bellilinea sp.]|nr:MAG: hypothetical protein KatS3mg046_132 [Bellilinea sp.]
MLHENPPMLNIDVNHWRNMQSLLLQSAKGKRRIIVIHENGEILKFVHSDRLPLVKPIQKVDNAQEAAKKVYEANAGKADFAMVLERRAVEKYFAEVQDSWKAEEDLDVYVHRMFAKLDEYPDGIATYPNKARENLGLQWKFGATYEAIEAALRNFIPSNSTVLFGIFKGNETWASLVLAVDENKQICDITTVDPRELLGTGGWKEASKEMVNWVNRKFFPCSLGFFTDVDSAKTFLAETDKMAVLKKLVAYGKVYLDPLPAALKALL